MEISLKLENSIPNLELKITSSNKSLFDYSIISLYC